MVKKLFSKVWNSSTQIRKQRKYRYNAPLNIKGKFLNTSLSKTLRADTGFRSIRVRKDDEVKVIAGQFKGKIAKVSKVNLTKTKVYLEGVGIKRSDKTLSLYPIHPSNLQIIKLYKDDKVRVEKIDRLKKLNQKGDKKK